MRTKFLAYATAALLCAAGVVHLLSARVPGGRGSGKWETVAEGRFIHEPRYLDVFFFDERNGLAVSELTIERSDDGGKKWVPEPTSVIRGFSSLAFTDGRSGWVVGTEGGKPLVMKTGDRGLHWQKVDFDEKSSAELGERFTFFSDVCFDGAGRGWLVGDGGVVRAEDGGGGLKASEIFPTETRLYAVSCDSSGEAWAVGQGGAVFHYQNGWSRKEVDKKYTFRRAVARGNDVWILGGVDSAGDNNPPEPPRAGVLLRSRDRGQTWENATPASAPWLYDLLVDGKSGWLVGDGGSIYHSSDDGNSWVKSESPARNDLRKIFFLDHRNGWIVGGGATTLKYRD